jgi:imidazolonepropionase-like amidohydrolase
MGTDRPVLFQNGLYDSIRQGLLPGARMLSAGYGFNIPANVDPSSMLGNLYRPASADAIPKEMDSIAALNVKIVKIWVDDMGGSAPKMEPAVYRAIIKEAHQRNIRVAAHLYYLSDARKLVNEGLDIIAHSIRDSVVDDAFVQLMKAHNVVYIPTLSLDKFNYAYSENPDWVDDRFFKDALEPGVYEMITSEKFKTEQKNSPALARNKHAFEIAMQNVKKLADGGVLIALGTDSGAFPVRVQGYSEHMELQLMNEAGLTPLQAIEAGTRNAAIALQLEENFGTIQKGKVADLLVLDGDPSTEIKNTRKIEAVYKAGKKIR